MTDLPTGTVTFLFTDVEGSTRLWETDRAMAGEAISRHMTVSEEEIDRAGGVMFKTTGDGVYAAFPSASAALEAALAMQASFTRSGPAVRMAVHTGSAEPSDGDYMGPTLNRTSRLLDSAHGGQVLVSLTTEELARDELPDGAMLKELGRYRFRDLTEPIRVFQLVHPEIGVDFPPLRTLDARVHNLPLALTSFVGRDRELAEVEDLLARSRLVTLVGVGGSGKTRLAVQAAAAVAERFGHGVWMVDLARLSDSDLVAPTVATTLGVPEQPGRSIVDVLGDALSGRSLLLILDNCEHLIGAVAGLADALLRSASRLTILATSREGLGIGGETLWQVPPLDVGSEAIELFVERAQAVKAGYEPDQDLEQIAQVCARLDGMPLAIELAAARMRALTAAQIADRLDDRFKLLTGGSRTALPRQQTLEAAVAWSYDLLAAEEKILFARLSVFAGFFDLEAAETVCGGDPLHSFEVLDLLARLVDKSLVLVQGDRYRLLETIRSYARAQLAETGQAHEVRHAHARHYRNLVEGAAERHLPDLDYFGLVESAVDNLRAAFGWLEISGRAAEAAGMTRAMTLYWMARAVGEGRHWAD
ncbi:MAG: adenylate/guanylate cyclase domain-containing protein, partial [Acidimicrobiia bacterium]